MLTRVIAALALVPLFIFIVIGGIPLYIAEIVILAMALREFYKAFNAINIHPIENIGYIFIAYMGLKNILNLGVEYTYIMIFLLLGKTNTVSAGVRLMALRIFCVEGFIVCPPETI